MILLSKNPVHSVFFLILVFCFSSGILLIIGAEFLAIIFVIVYVGAIAVLFLFVVMMLNVRLIDINQSILKYIPIGGVVGFIFLIELYYIFKYDFVTGQENNFIALENWLNSLNSVSNLKLLGEVLYTYYVYYFIIGGLVLLVAMIGSIVLTLHHQINVKRQLVYKQLGRDCKLTVVKKVLV
jgi:NADH:ubiquinone oxidoreductase subunit 6 (subunit J)